MEEQRQETLRERGLRNRLEELQKQAAKDALSGLLNRVTAEQYITARLKEMKPEDSCALFIVDLDDFKRVNDTLGHQAGDQAIRRSAQILSGIFRASDIVGRLGGDEFIVFVGGCVTEEAAVRQANAICEELQLTLGDDDPLVSVTASVGIYLTTVGQQSFADLYRAADQALYAAKKGGKHSFCLKQEPEAAASEEMSQPVNAVPLTKILDYMDSGIALLEMGEPISVIYASPTYRRIFGLENRDFTMPVLLANLVHPEDRMELVRALR